MSAGKNGNYRSLASKLAARLGTWLKSHKATSKLGQLIYSDVKAARDAYVRLLNESRGAQAKGEGELRYSVEYGDFLSDQNILDLLERVKIGDFKASDKVWLGVVSDNVAEMIREATGIDVKGYKVAIEARQLEHILNTYCVVRKRHRGSFVLGGLGGSGNKSPNALDC